MQVEYKWNNKKKKCAISQICQNNRNIQNVKIKHCLPITSNIICMSK